MSASQDILPELTSNQVNVLKVITTQNPISQQSKKSLFSISDAMRTDVTSNATKNDVLQQLTTHALPLYTPKSQFIIDNRGTEVKFDCHSCAECGDSFICKSSLTFHLERRSVFIKFPCSTCLSDLIFYNRCALLSHIRGHAEQEKEPEIMKAVVSPLPHHLMDSALGQAADEDGDEGNTVSPTDLMECSLKEMNEDSVTASEVPEKEMCILGAGPKQFKCLDCGLEFPSQEAREQHVVNGDQPPLAAHQCTKCDIFCPSKCSLKAHQRIHLQVSPYVCPECGDSPDPHWVIFQRHVNYKCFHNSRTVGYCCPVCKRVFSGMSALVKHMDVHIYSYINCEFCPRAYMTYPAFKGHIATYHKNVEGKVPWKMIYKCALCDNTYTNHEHMAAHRSEHLKEQEVCKYYFNCVQCGKPTGSKSALLDHIKASHPSILQAMAEDPPKKEQELPAFDGKVECLLCHTTLSTAATYATHINRAHTNLNQTCTSCFMIVKDRTMMILHGKAHISNGTPVCLLCNNLKFRTPTLLDEHLKKHVLPLRRTAVCPVCQDRLKPRAMHEHLRKEHLLAPLGSAVPTPAAPVVASCHFCRTSFAHEHLLQEHLRERHNVDSLRTPDNSAIFGTPSAPEASESEKSGSVCCTCGSDFTDRKEFKEHILTHKSSRGTHQCLECGAIYKTFPTLCKHLKFSHAIQDPEKYVEAEGANFVSEDGSQSKSLDVDSLICSVCFTSFSSELLLKTHMRSHGMAFIQAKKNEM